MEMMINNNAEKLQNVQKDIKNVEKRIDKCDEQLKKLYELYFPNDSYDDYMNAE